MGGLRGSVAREGGAPDRERGAGLRRDHRGNVGELDGTEEFGRVLRVQGNFAPVRVAQRMIRAERSGRRAGDMIDIFAVERPLGEVELGADDGRPGPPRYF